MLPQCLHLPRQYAFIPELPNLFLEYSVVPKELSWKLQIKENRLIAASSYSEKRE
jgi:hypothetical protein